MLVFFCWRTYQGRTVQYRRSRRLSTTEGGGNPIQICGSSTNEESQLEHHNPHLSDSAAAEEYPLPLKKRLLARVVEAGTGGGERNPHNQGHQQHHHGSGEVQVNYFPPQTFPMRDQVAHATFSVPNLLSSSHLRTPPVLDPATGLSNLPLRQHRAGQVDSGKRYKTPKKSRQLKSQIRRTPRQLQQERRHRQQVHLRQHDDTSDPNQQQHLHWGHVGWQKQPEQLQPLLKRKKHPPALPQQDQRQVIQTQKQQQATEAREQQLEQTKSKRGQQEKPQQPQDLLQPADTATRYLLEDKWVAPEFSSPQAPQPSTSQQVLQFSAAKASESPSTSASSSVQVISGFPLDLGAHASTAGGGDSRDGAAAAPAEQAAAAKVESCCDLSSSGATAPIGEDMIMTVPGSSSSLILDTTTDANKAAAAVGKAAAAAVSTGASSSMPIYVPSPSITKLLGTQTADHERKRPFVSLPKRIKDTSSDSISVEFERAVTSRRIPCSAWASLHKAHKLLSQEVLVDTHMMELAQIAEDLVGNAMHFQGQDLSQHQTYRAVERLAIRFMLLDVVVSTLMILEQKPDPGQWKRFAEAISDAAPDPATTANYTQRALFSLSLAQELGRGIRILKTGKRPHPDELVKIRRMLFCSPLSPARFRERDFDHWRLEDGTAPAWS
ncbi:hypothetical protein EMWEY_00015000 [Eimeria maxima]|uniref:Uncharacterized protein n=1 Tax=Eimeria maxima TaxID=5804 RepID=U6M9G1_EIMMA|nr:hypothetical protein EMWEY_00015000 [Eimeria maxima]CDJ58310.1 hypothetical protein EMWEY_00015000 [Eimeria maxima]